MAILQIVEHLTDILNQGVQIPLSRYRLVNADEMNQMIERLRISVPSSIRESERTIAERDNILAQARADADQILHQARQQAMEMLSEESLVQIARQEADRIVAEGKDIAKGRTDEADRYAAEVLQELSERLHIVSKQVNNGLKMMQADSSE